MTVVWNVTGALLRKKEKKKDRGESVIMIYSSLSI